jgi:hypothetical protein
MGEDVAGVFRLLVVYANMGILVMRLPQSTPAKKREYQWAISLIRHTGKFLVCYVGAPDAGTAIQEAIKRFGITDLEQQGRLIAQRGD